MNSSNREIVDINKRNKSFLEINQKAFKELLTFIDFADEKLNIAFAEINFAQDRDLLIEKLIEHPNCQDIQLEILDFSDPNLRFVRDELIAALQNIQIAPDKKLILLITGLEKSIGVLDEYPDVLVNLNFVRDDLSRTVPHPMLLFLPDYALTRLAKYAPDFWAWNKKVFYFKSDKPNIYKLIDDPILVNNHIVNWELSDKKERIELLLRLLSEYHDKDHEKQKLAALINIYDELSVSFNALGDYQQAIYFCQKSINLAQDVGDKNANASSLNNLGNTYYSLGEYERAIDCFQRSLKLQQQIGNHNEKSYSLRSLGNVYYSLGKYEQAIYFHQQSLVVSRNIGDINSEIQSLNNLGNVYYSIKKYEKAIGFHQQSLSISRKIGNLYVEAISTGNLANNFYSLGEYKNAIDFHQQSLRIKQHIGNRRGEVDSFIGLGITYSRIEDYQNAVEFYQQAQEIAHKISYLDGEARSYFNLGNVWARIKNKPKAILAFENAKKLRKKMKLNKKIQDCDHAIQELENQTKESN